MMSTNAFSSLLLVVLAGGVCLQASPIITYQVTTLNAAQSKFRYTYFLSGIDLLKNEELDVKFAATNYDSLSNGKAGADLNGMNSPNFNLLLLEPNGPTGSTGDYSLLATVDHPAFTGTFSVDFIYLGAGSPGMQTFFLFDDRGPGPSTQIGPPGATQLATSAAPEPPNFGLSAVGSLVLLASFGLRRRAKQ